MEDVQTLFRVAFNKKVGVDYLQQKYNTAHTGVKHLTYLAYDGDVPIGFYGAIPQQFQHGNDTFLGVHTCDSFVHPNYQRQGLHQHLAEMAYKLMQENGIQFVYAFHSEATYHSCKKLGWQEYQHMKGFYIKTGGIPHAKIYPKLGMDQSLNKRLNKILGPHAAQSKVFENSHQRHGRMCVAYTPEFFNYKSFTPNFILPLDGATFWVKVAGAMCVGDVSFETEEGFLNGLKALQQLAKKAGCTELLFQTHVDSALEQVLSKHYEGFESWLVGYLMFNEVPIHQWSTNFGDLDTF